VRGRNKSSAQNEQKRERTASRAHFRPSCSPERVYDFVNARARRTCRARARGDARRRRRGGGMEKVSFFHEIARSMSRAIARFRCFYRKLEHVRLLAPPRPPSTRARVRRVLSENVCFL